MLMLDMMLGGGVMDAVNEGQKLLERKDPSASSVAGTGSTHMELGRGDSELLSAKYAENILARGKYLS
jgi:hypothetical protein